jgi:Macrocin-O-methyltransferase (TylF)
VAAADMNKLDRILEATAVEVSMADLVRMSPDGLIMEFGVGMGTTLSEIWNATGRTVYGFDSFHGLPEDWRYDVPKRSFTTFGFVPRVAPHVQIVAGWIEETLPYFLSAVHDRVAFVHFDMDLYSSTSFALSAMKDRFEWGAILLFDEFTEHKSNVEHEQRAFREFLDISGREFECVGRRHNEAWAFRLL